MSRSSGYVWLRPVSVTVARVSVPGKLEMLIVEGYSEATPLVPLAGMEIAVPFVLLVEFTTNRPRGNVLLKVPRALVPSARSSTQVIEPPQTPSAAKVKG